MSLDVSLSVILCENCWNSEEVYSANITHNLGKMAEKVWIYKYLRRLPKWVSKARQIIEPLEEWLKKLKKNPDYYSQFNAENWRWLYEHFVPFVENYLNACIKYPNADIIISV
jgi:hypothetical protein